MKRKRPESPLWKYLDELGILEKGSDFEIKAAKKEYRKKYLTNYKKRQREHKPEFTINFSKAKGEYETILIAAKKHKRTPASFIRSAVFAYLQQSFIVPNIQQVVMLEQLLSDCLNEIKSITSKRDQFFWDKEQKIEMMEKRIVRLEAEISRLFRNPPLLANHDHQNQVP